MTLVYAILIVIIICIIFRMMKLREEFSLNFGFQTPGTDPLVCSSPKAMAEAKRYYDNVGEMRQLYSMDPISSVRVDDSNCDVKFTPIPGPTNTRKDTSIDARRFTYARDPKNWKVAAMGGWKSGTNNI
jgi:hypothetical protein